MKTREEQVVVLGALASRFPSHDKVRERCSRWCIALRISLTSASSPVTSINTGMLVKRQTLRVTFKFFDQTDR
jgi:hypothetical protein